MGKLDGKVALITGAGSGMGQATAYLFAQEGAKVGVVDIAPAGGQETLVLIKDYARGEAVFIEADVSKAADAERMVKTVVDTYGRLDILYNNAGISHPMALMADITEEDWDRIIDVNLKGVFLGSKYAIPVMIDQGGGVIINTASSTGVIGMAGLSVYTASKGGIVLLTKSMALDYAVKNIRVNCICPGIIMTQMAQRQFEGLPVPDDPEEIRKMIQSLAPLGGFFGPPDAVAQAALYLASDDASYVSGAALMVDGCLSAGITNPLL